MWFGSMLLCSLVCWAECDGHSGKMLMPCGGAQLLLDQFVSIHCSGSKLPIP